MDDYSSRVLQYGHMGHASYNPETQSWTFARSLHPSRPVLYSGITRTTVPPSCRQSPRFSVQETRDSLLKAHPQLAPAWSSYAREEKLSLAISQATKDYDPRISSLFDLGIARGQDWENDARSFPVAVTATGECAERLCFRVLDEDAVKLELEGEAPESIRVPAVGAVDMVEWVGSSRTSVRQISFARIVQGSRPALAAGLWAHWNRPMWMAARFAHSTTIFRPVYHRKLAPTYVGDAGDGISPMMRSSRIHPNAVVDIPSSRTGGFEHADVTFNPWYEKEFAIVDEVGNWSIWDVSGTQKPRPNTNDTWIADCVKSGVLPRPSIHDRHDSPRHDGWARVEWVTDSTTLVVSDRRSIMLYRTQGDRPTLFYTLELGLGRKSEWILDVMRSLHDLSHLFILTTSRILWFDLSFNTFASADEEGGSSFFPRLSWYHFRDSEDTTLQLSPLLAGNGRSPLPVSLVQC